VYEAIMLPNASTTHEAVMQISALNAAAAEAVTAPRKIPLVLLTPSQEALEIIQSPEENDFIFTRHHSPTSD